MTVTSQSREKGIIKYCESNHIYFIIVLTISFRNGWMGTRVELLPAFKCTGKLVKIKEFTGKW